MVCYHLSNDQCSVFILIDLSVEFNPVVPLLHLAFKTPHSLFSLLLYWSPEANSTFWGPKAYTIWGTLFLKKGM